MYGRNARCESKIGSFFSAQFIFAIRAHEDRKNRTVDAERGLDNVRDEFLFCFFILICKLDTRRFSVSRKIEIDAICETPQFFAAERILKFKINRALAVVRTLIVRHLELAEHTFRYANCFGKKMHYLAPLFERLPPFIRLHEIFHFHLCQFAQAEDEVARRDLVSKRLPDLRDAERKFWMHRIHYIFEIRENASGSFRPQVRSERFFSRAN